MNDRSDADGPRPERVENEALAERLGVLALSLRVEGADDLTPSCRRIRLGGGDLEALDPLAGQDLMISLGAEGGRTRRRRYSIRHYDRAARRVDLDVALHGTGPGIRWAASVSPGDAVEAVGPRGKISLDPDADWHLFIGDDSFAPASLNMAEAVDPAKEVLLAIEVDGPGHEHPHRIRANLGGPVWVMRDGATGSSAALEAALAATTLPSGRGHAYVGGEHSVVRTLRDALIARGMEPESVSFKPYWRLGRQNAANGEPERS